MPRRHQQEVSNTKKYKHQYLISGFCLEVNENCCLLGSYTASSGNSLPTFQDSLSVPFSGSWPLVTLVRNYHYSLCNSPEERSFRAPVHLSVKYRCIDACTSLYLRFSEDGITILKHVEVFKTYVQFVLLSFAFVDECDWVINYLRDWDPNLTLELFKNTLFSK